MPYVFLFIQQIFEHLLCARNNARCQGCSNEQNGQNFEHSIWGKIWDRQYTNNYRIYQVSVFVKYIEIIGEERSIAEYV